VAFDTDILQRLQRLKKLEALLAEVKKRTIRHGDGVFEWRLDDYPDVGRNLTAALDETPGKYKEVK
jgi:hypothetical protein